MKPVATSKSASAPRRPPVSRWAPAVRGLVGGQTAYLAVCDFGRDERIGMVRQGLPARLLVRLANDMQIPRERLYGWLGIARTTANRKVKNDERLSQDESERALGLTRLVGQVQRIVTESGNTSGFDAARWTANWLDEPNAALAGRAPGGYMDTADGRSLVSALVAQMQSGAYA